MHETTIRWVLHRHTLRDGSWHFDLMIGPWPGLADGEDGDDGPEARSLRSWRVAVHPLQADRFDAEAGPDHRRAYLDLAERTLDADRGTVQRVAGGAAELIEPGHDRVIVRLSDAGAAVRLIGQRDAARATAWRFTRG